MLCSHWVIEVQTLSDANDVKTCQSNIVVPDSWHIFMKHLCHERSNSDDFDGRSYIYFN